MKVVPAGHPVLLLLVLCLACSGGDAVSPEPRAQVSAADTPVAQGPEVPVDDGADPLDDPLDPPREPVDGVVVPEIGEGRLIVDTGGMETPSGYLPFGSDADVVLAAVADALGPAESDSGLDGVGADPGCPNASRVVRFGALVLVFSDASTYRSDAVHLSGWDLRGLDPRVEVVAFDSRGTAFPVEPSLTVVADLRAAFGEAISVNEQAPSGPGFELQEATGVMTGTLTGPDDDDVVVDVATGEECET